MPSLTVFSKAVKKALVDRDWSSARLAQEVSKNTGMFCDQAYISRILTGQRKAPKIVQAIREILELPEESQDTV